MYKSLAIAYDVVKCSILFQDTFFIFVMEEKKNENAVDDEKFKK